MKITIIRGSFLNPFELQNYYPLIVKHQITCVSSKFPINDRIKLPLQKLWSLTDIPLPFKYAVLNRIFKDAHYLFGLQNIINGSDVVHVAETYFHYTLQALYAKRKGLVKKVVSTVWEVIPHNNESLPGRRCIKEVARTETDHFLAVTNVAKQTLIKEGVSENKITVVPMGVDLSRFKPAKTQRKKAKNILFVGRLVPEKGIGELLSAYAAEKFHNPQLTLTLIGSGPLKNKCLAAGAIVKQASYQQIHREYKNADIFILPSKPTQTWEEQYGMVLIEAMACGLPIITTNTPVLHEVCGPAALYFLPGDSLQLSSQLHALINDDQLRSKLSQTSLKLAMQRYDHRKIAKQIQKVYAS